MSPCLPLALFLSSLASAIRVSEDLDGHWRSFGADTACQADASDHNKDGHGTAVDEPAESLAACKALCSSQETCQGIAFNQQTGMCSVWHEPIGEATSAAGSECLQLLAAGPPEERSAEDDPRKWPRQGKAEHACPPSVCADGDEVLDPTQKEASLLETNSSVRTFVAHRWPQGVVKYYWDPAIGKEAKEALEQAMMEWEAKTCIRFEETRKAAGVVRLQSSGDGCRGHVGYSPYHEHFVNIGENCEIVGIAVHELGHAIGLGHEHQRADAPNYVEVVDVNIEAENRQWFVVQREGEIAAHGVPYDLASVMHYGSHFFAINNDGRDETRSIKVKKKDVYGNCQVGQRNFLSTGDILTVNNWYGCPDRFCADLNADCEQFVSRNLCKDPKYGPWMAANCRHSCDLCVCKDSDDDCADLAEKGFCVRGDPGQGSKTNKEWMAQNCPKSCGRCSHDDKALCKDRPYAGDPKGCEKRKGVMHKGKPVCHDTDFFEKCPKTCNLCPHVAFCW